MGNSVEIKNIFQKDITRKINGVVKAEQNEEAIVITELSEYVVTEELKKHLEKFFDRYTKSLSSPTEDIGVWISGFYGSGKSHFLKMIGRILENREYDGKKVSVYFKEKINDVTLQSNIEKASETPTDVILFNVDTVSDQESAQNKDSIAVAFLKNFNGYLGFDKNNLKIADFERNLWENGMLNKFTEKFEEIVGKPWKEEKRNLDFLQDEFIEVLEELDIMSGESAERWLEKDDKVSVSPESFADLLEHYLKLKDSKHRIVFLVDEIGQYIGENSQLMLNLQTLVEILGIRFQGRVWVGVTSQQDLGNILGSGTHRRNDFSKIQDRFKTMLSLSSGNIDEVIKKRLLEKKKVDKEELEKMYDENYVNINNTISFDKQGISLLLYNNKYDFAETYPFVGYQFNLLQKVFEKIRDMGYSGQHMSRGERSLLSSFQEAGIRVKDEMRGALVPFNYFFESINQFLEDVARRPFIHAKNEKGVDDFGLEVLKLLFLLKGINGIEANINNLTSFMIDSIDCDRVELESKIKKALNKLEKEVLIQKDGENYYFLTNEEQDINKEINQESFEYSEVHKQIDSYIFGEIFTKSSIISETTGAKYGFNRRVDEYNTSRRTEPLDIIIFTPEADDYKNVELLGVRGEEYELIVRLPENDVTYIDEIKQSIKIESFIKRKTVENTREVVTQILTAKSKENSNRKKRIKRLIEEALLEAEVFVYGQKIVLTKVSDGAKVIEQALKAGAEHRFKSAKLIKKPYDEKRIKEVLSYSYEEGNTLFDIKRDLSANPNVEAIEEVRNRIDLLSKRGMTITLQSLVEYFGKSPYGWGVFSVNGIIAELWVYKIVDIEESKEKITKADDLKDILTKSQTRFLDRIVIILKEEIDTELVKKVNNIIRGHFGASNEITITSPKEELLKILEEKKKNADRSYRICDKNNYPGKKELKEWQELLEDIISLKNYKTEKFLKEFLSMEEEITTLYEKQSEVEEFLNTSRREIFDDGVFAVREIDENTGYLKSLKETEPYKELVSIVTDKKPYSRIREIEDYIKNLKEKEKTLIENEKENLKRKAQAEQKKLEGALEKRDALLERSQDEFAHFIVKIERLESIKNIMSETKELENITTGIENSYKKSVKSELEYIKQEILTTFNDKTDIADLYDEVVKSYDKLKTEAGLRELTELEELIAVALKDKEQFIEQGNGKAKKKERIKLKKVNTISKYNIETEEEAQEYIEKIEDELKKLKEEIFKAIHENKIVDIN